MSYVRSAGWFPAVRCGRQPYGVLPVTSLDLWKPDAADAATAAREAFLRDLLVRLRDSVWRPHLPDTARVGRRTTPPDADADLADVMRTDAVSAGYRTRALLGRHYLQHLRAFMGEDLQGRGFTNREDDSTGAILARFGFTWRPPLARATYADLFWRVSVPLVQAGEISPWRPLEPNYIADFLGARTIDEVIAARPDPAAPATASLLRVLLRHALLREYAHAAALIAAGEPGADLRVLERDVELVDLVPGAGPVATWRRQLDRVVSGVTGTKTIRQFLEGLATFEAPAARSLGAFRASLAHLQGLDSERLLLLMQGTLDLAGPRLDAWITSLATGRLAAMRADAPRGVYAGGYGWVENLVPAAPLSTVTTPPAGEEGPLFALPDDTGFIHAPSLTHAATAALLRNAHLGSGGAVQPDGPFAIDLSSRRVRQAAWVLDGMRQEQPLGALLGYRFERWLHEGALDRFVQPMRELAPLTAARLVPASAPLDTVAPNNVVDGVALSRLWQAHASQVTARLQQAGADAAEQATIARLIGALGDTIDAVGDSLVAEAAYQMLRGNTARTASTLQAIAEGEAPPPELEVARTPRSGAASTHRVVVCSRPRRGRRPAGRLRARRRVPRRNRR